MISDGGGCRRIKCYTAVTPVFRRMAALRQLATDCRGMTLIEVLMTTVLLSVLLGAAYFLVNSTMHSWKKSEAQIAVQQDLRLVMDRLTRELRASAGIDELSARSHIVFKNPDNTKYIKYFLDGREIKRAISSNKIHWDGNNAAAGQIYEATFSEVAGLPATVEVKLTGINGFILTSRVTVRMMRGQN